MNLRHPRPPLATTETPYYEYGDLYEYGDWEGRPHPGVDFHEREGAHVYAAGEGIVRVSQDDPRGYGQYMVVEHLTTRGLVWTLYAHLSLRRFGAGAVLRGEDILIGFEGHTGYSDNLSHVHYEVKRTPQLGLYARLTADNLDEYYHSPRQWLNDPEVWIVPVDCWTCEMRGE